MEGNKNNEIQNENKKIMEEKAKSPTSNILPPKENQIENSLLKENNIINETNIKINENKTNIIKNNLINSSLSEKDEKCIIKKENNTKEEIIETNNILIEKDLNKEKKIKIDNINEEEKENEKKENINKNDENNNIQNVDENMKNNSLYISPLNQAKDIIKKEKYRTRISSIKKTGCRNVNNYKIVEDHIGEGTFGMVFKAEYIGDMDYADKMGIPKYVALKKIKMEDSKEGFPITALREIMIMKKCNHENLLQILEIVTSKSLIKSQKKQNVYLVFEYMEHDLSGLALAKYKFKISQIKYIMYQILKGVQYLHKNNIIHRDIKCANILINNKGKIKIGDFGLARNIIPNHTKKYTYKVVTLWFRAPELLFGETLYGTAIDVWSCGCVFGELLTGNCPFQGKDEESLMKKICEKCGTPNETNWPGVTKLPLYNKLCPRTIFPNSFNEHFKNYPDIDEVTLDLLSKMLQLDPKKRITIDDALNHPFFLEHKPNMCTEKDMPIFDKDYHEYEYSHQHKKIKEQSQNIAKKDYLNKQNINHNHNKNSFNNSNNKDYHFNFLGKKHYQDKSNNKKNHDNDDGW